MIESLIRRHTETSLCHTLSEYFRSLHYREKQIMADYDANHYSDGDIDTNMSQNRSLEAVVEARYSRRQALFSGAAATGAAFLGGAVLTACGDGGDNGPNGTVSATGGTTSSGAVFGLSAMVTNATEFATFAWTQTAGPNVTIINPTSLTASFLAPSVASATPLTFSCAGTTAGGPRTAGPPPRAPSERACLAPAPCRHRATVRRR